MYLLFYKVHSDCCGKLWSQKTDRLWPEARGLHQADTWGAELGQHCDWDGASSWHQWSRWDSDCSASFPFIDHVISAVLITGGEGALKSAEIYHPDHDTPCVLPDLPDDRLSHTQDGSLLCGGRWTPRSCQRWNADTGSWVLVTDSLIEDRRYHISWTPRESSDTYLIGGYKSGNTSEAIALDFDNGVTSSFLLQHRTEYD